ncbi:aspartate aminotransferase family protein [Streptomyces sp. H27-D2]|uniref:aspartate aminotransferase family protein n=1 Tax=Streptomyces sp. H27-D2 TaxID=3046304 RepID=UPI002DB7FEBD|nr:aspartate aminotransferase family protein [Streptomyces sp. H27-D2]MEC4019437.1 aspartate aminotransferase family protein [Streptomyces sp. H27-D2]
MRDSARIQDLIYYPVSEYRMDHGEGVYLYDVDGQQYIDCASGTFNLSLGYEHPEVVKAIREQAEQLIHVTSTFQTDTVNALVTRLAEISPANLTKVHLKVSGGSTANEGAVKMAQFHTGRRDVISLFRSHHGNTMLTTGMSGEAFRRAPFPMQPAGLVHVPDPYCLRCFYKQHPDTCGLLCVERINDFIDHASSGSVACLIVEPVSGSGGNVVAPDGYLAALRGLCDERDIVLIFDEVQTGIGRVGRMFAAEHFGVSPDIITTAKGLGGSGAQVAAILADDRLSGMGGEYHSFTYGANVLAAAAAVATLDVIGQRGFLEHVREVGAYIKLRLEELATRHRGIGEVRGLGLMIGIEIVDPHGAPDTGRALALARLAMDHGLILRTSRYGRGNVVKIRPPLVITRAEADLLCDRLDALFTAEAA